MYQRILVAVDGSPPSSRAVTEAINLAKDQHAALRVIHVIDDPYAHYAANDLPPETMAAIEQARWKAGQKILDQALAVAGQGGVQCDSAVLEREDRVNTTIVEDATRWHADLIVIGTHGRHGLGHLLLGSVAEGVARAANIPVLLVHGG